MKKLFKVSTAVILFGLMSFSIPAYADSCFLRLNGSIILDHLPCDVSTTPEKVEVEQGNYVHIVIENGNFLTNALNAPTTFENRSKRYALKSFGKVRLSKNKTNSCYDNDHVTLCLTLDSESQSSSGSTAPNDSVVQDQQSSKKDLSQVTGFVHLENNRGTIDGYHFDVASSVGKKIIGKCEGETLCSVKFHENEDKGIIEVAKLQALTLNAPPKEVIEFIYSHYSGWSELGLHDNEDTNSRLFTSSLNDLFKSSSKISEDDHEEGETTPWLQDQEWKLKIINFKVDPENADRVGVQVVLRNLLLPNPQDQTYSYLLIKQRGAWRIFDAIAPSLGDGEATPFSLKLRQSIDGYH